MHTLDSLPSEVLAAIIQELVAFSYDYEQAAFGRTLKALALVNRRFAKATEPYRYRDWEFVEEKREGRLEQHLSRPSWSEHVQYLTVPVYDCRAVSRVRKSKQKDITAYDTLLAQVVRSAVSLKQITLVFDVEFSEDHPRLDENDRILLPRTLQACIDHKEVTQLRCHSVSDLIACKEACRVIRNWTTLTTVEILKGTYPIDFDHELEIIRSHLEAVAQRDDLRELSYTINSFNETIAQPVAMPSTPTPRQGLSKLHIACTDAFKMDAWSLLIHQSIHVNPGIKHLDIPIYVLHLAATQGAERLDLSRLEVLRMDMDSLVHFKVNASEVFTYLYTQTGLFTSDSALSRLHLSGPRSVDLAEFILSKPPIPSLRWLTVRYPLHRKVTKKRLGLLWDKCEPLGICLASKGEEVW